MAHHRLVQKQSHFQAYCKDRIEKHTFCPLKYPKIEFFIANNSPKKTSAAENLDYDRTLFLRSVHTKIGCMPPIGAEKSRFEELKRRGMSRMGKKTKA